MRVLILSANTGGGHNSTARALVEQLEKLNIEYEIADTLAFISERVSEFISWGHSYVYRKHPRLFGFGYRFEEKHPPRFIYEQCAKGSDALQKHLENGGYDAVICVHVFSGMMMNEVRERFHNHIPAFFIATDYTCSPGVSEQKLDGYFIPHRMLLGEFVRNGDIPADKLHVTGIPIGSCFYEREDKREARRALGLPEDGKIAVLTCGSMGCGKLEKSARFLMRHMPSHSTLVVLCGSNEKTYRELLPHATDRFRVLSFTDQMPRYMSAADVYITKPGGLSTSEAIAKRVPMIFINAVPGVETRNFDFLVEQGVAMGAKNWLQVIGHVQKALRDPDSMKEQIEAMEIFTTKNASEAICRHVVDYVKNR